MKGEGQGRRSWRLSTAKIGNTSKELQSNIAWTILQRPEEQICNCKDRQHKDRPMRQSHWSEEMAYKATDKLGHHIQQAKLRLRIFPYPSRRIALQVPSLHKFWTELVNHCQNQYCLRKALDWIQWRLKRPQKPRFETEVAKCPGHPAKLKLKRWVKCPCHRIYTK